MNGIRMPSRNVICGVKFNLDPWRPSLILKKIYNSFRRLFVGSCNMSMTTFVQIRWTGSDSQSLNKKAICRIFSKHARCVIWMPWNIKSTKSLIGQSENLNVSSSAVYGAFCLGNLPWIFWYIQKVDKQIFQMIYGLKWFIFKI